MLYVPHTRTTQREHQKFKMGAQLVTSTERNLSESVAVVRRQLVELVNANPILLVGVNDDFNMLVESAREYVQLNQVKLLDNASELGEVKRDLVESRLNLENALSSHEAQLRRKEVELEGVRRHLANCRSTLANVRSLHQADTVLLTGVKRNLVDADSTVAAEMRVFYYLPNAPNAKFHLTSDCGHIRAGQNILQTITGHQILTSNDITFQKCKHCRV